MTRIVSCVVPSLATQRRMLAAAPCPQCGVVEICDDSEHDRDGLLSATCDCGADAGACTAWGIVEATDIPSRAEDGPGLCRCPLHERAEAEVQS